MKKSFLKLAAGAAVMASMAASMAVPVSAMEEICPYFCKEKPSYGDHAPISKYDLQVGGLYIADTKVKDEDNIYKCTQRCLYRVDKVWEDSICFFWSQRKANVVDLQNGKSWTIRCDYHTFYEYDPELGMGI
ncbi:MAG: hypothetical protein HUJ54_13990, partial [Erysipelotrichaceae bacterium]|nr:hypothetical protein [Erysipelotrichaceae bacterium]